MADDKMLRTPPINGPFAHNQQDHDDGKFLLPIAPCIFQFFHKRRLETSQILPQCHRTIQNQYRDEKMLFTKSTQKRTVRATKRKELFVQEYITQFKCTAAIFLANTRDQQMFRAKFLYMKALCGVTTVLHFRGLVDKSLKAMQLEESNKQHKKSSYQVVGTKAVIKNIGRLKNVNKQKCKLTYYKCLLFLD